MATSQQQLNFAIKAVNEASGTLKQLQNDINGLGDASSHSTRHTTGLGNSLSSMSKIAGGFVVGSALVQLPGLLMNSAKAAADDAAETARLDTALANLTERTGAAAGSLKALQSDMVRQIAAGQKLGFTDTQVRDSVQQLLAATDDYTESTTRSRLAMDLARGANIDLTTASRLLGKINEENVQVFKRMGITLAEGATEAEALAAVQAKFGGQAEAFANSTAGQFEVAKIQMEELKEQVGTALLPVMVKLAPVVIKVFEALAKVPAPVLAIGVGLASLAAAAAVLAGPITAIIGLFGGLAGGVGALAGGAGFLALLGPIGLVVAAIAAAIAIGVLIYKNWDTIKEKASELGGWLADRFNYIKDRAGDLKEWVVTAFTRVSDFLSGAFHALMNNALVKIALMFTPVGPLMILFQFKDKIADALGGIGDVFERAFGPVYGVLSKVGGWLGGLIDKIADFTGRGVSAAANAVAGLGMGAGGPRFTGIPTWENTALASVADSEGFATGGVIPGPRGMPVLIKAHSGEHITPVGGSAVAPNITINFPSGVILDSEATVQRWILSALHIARQRGDLGFA